MSSVVLELTVENIAIIDRAQIALGPGFTALTGETGAGKSLLVDAIDLALGGRADSDLVRVGSSRGLVTLVADLSGNRPAVERCAELGIELEDGQLFVAREVSAEGRSTCRIGGKLAPVGNLRQIGALMVDLHGQHDHQSLLDPSKHLDYLDDWIGSEARDLRAQVAAEYRTVEDLHAKQRALHSGARDREQRIDLLRFQIGEIEALEPRPGEMEELETTLSRLQYAERLAQASVTALEDLGGEQGANDRLGAALKGLEACERLDPTLGEVLELLRDARYRLEDGLLGLRSYADELEIDPAALEATAARIDGLKRLRRKYGDDEPSILAYLEAARAELDLLTHIEEGSEDLGARLTESERRLTDLCAELSACRKRHAERFGGLVATELQDLAMDRAAFVVQVGSHPADATGADAVEFFFSANAGEPPKPLSKIASGGEISRVMLALKVVLAGRAGVPTLIFDEVDAGLSGRAAAAVARKLEQIAQHYQVVVISHLPQIAGRATVHFRIEKVQEGNRTVTRVRRLSPDERVHEIARMLAGEEITAPAMENARTLLGTSSA